MRSVWLSALHSCRSAHCRTRESHLLSPARFSIWGSAAGNPQSRRRPPPPHSKLEPTATSATTLLPELASSHQVRACGSAIRDMHTCRHSALPLQGDTSDRCNPMDLKYTQESLIRQIDTRYTRSLLYQAYILRQTQCQIPRNRPFCCL